MDALQNAKKKGYSTFLERYKDDDTYSSKMTEQGLKEDVNRRRDEEGKIDRFHNTNATKKSCGKHLFRKEKLWI